MFFKGGDLKVIVTCEICGKKKEVRDNYFMESTQDNNPDEQYFCSNCVKEIDKLILSFGL